MLVPQKRYGENVVIHTEPNETEIINAIEQVSMLIDYFALNLRDPQARNYYLRPKLLMVKKLASGIKEK